MNQMEHFVVCRKVHSGEWVVFKLNHGHEWLLYIFLIECFHGQYSDLWIQNHFSPLCAETNCLVSRGCVFSRLYLVQHITSDLWNIINVSQLRKIPCNHTVWSHYSWLWVYWCCKCYSLDYRSIQAQKYSKWPDLGVQLSCTSSDETSHCLYIYSHPLYL